MKSAQCSMEMNKTDNFANELAELCYSKYMSLPKTGKPNEEREWTLLAGIVKVEGWQKEFSCSSNMSMDVVALGTGSKCIGKSKMSPSGDILNDSHAEVMARRGFLRYLYHQILETYQTGSSEVFKCFSGGKCVIKDNITFHFFTSHTPCGDASIIPKVPLCEDEVGSCLKCDTKESPVNTKQSEGIHLCCSTVMVPTGNLCCDFSCANLRSEMTEQTMEGEEHDGKAGVARGKRKCRSDEDCEEDSGCKCKKVNLSSGRANICGGSKQRSRVNYQEELVENNMEEVLISDIYRTGAKCLPFELLQDSHLPGTDYHVVGALRTKPGRGDSTQSLSCSDKFARWNVVGLQGALLSLLVNEPVYFKSLIIGGGCPFSKASLKRAVIERLIYRNNGENNSSEDKKDQASTISDSLSLPSKYAVVYPLILQSAVPFKHARTPTGKKQPCPSSIVWCKVPERLVFNVELNFITVKEQKSCGRSK
jgi:tRNA-specific adenosine deaminase 1